MSASDTIFTWAEAYCVSLSTEFADSDKLTVEALNKLTDDWVKSVVLEVQTPSEVALACMVCGCCLNEDWVSLRLRMIFWTLGLQGITGNLTLVKYLLWRFEKYFVECQQSQEASNETMEGELESSTIGEDE